MTSPSFIRQLYEAHRECPTCPSPNTVADFFAELLGTLFPDFSKMVFADMDEFQLHVAKLEQQLQRIIYHGTADGLDDGKSAVQAFFDQLPGIREQLQQDATAIYEWDPAADSRREVIHTYPGFYAIAAYRLAHALYSLDVKTVPRMITEHAHSRTGIDIHPAAQIGSHFFIDHGTGVVIGETTQIGEHVKIYQGVTLGALSVNKEDARRKRHPTIGDRVVIYSGATILGGDTVIGDDCVIGGNVWITRSVPPATKVYYQAQMHHEGTGQTDRMVYRDTAS